MSLFLASGSTARPSPNRMALCSYRHATRSVLQQRQQNWDTRSEEINMLIVGTPQHLPHLLLTGQLVPTLRHLQQSSHLSNLTPANGPISSGLTIQLHKEALPNTMPLETLYEHIYFIMTSFLGNLASTNNLFPKTDHHNNSSAKYHDHLIGKKKN